MTPEKTNRDQRPKEHTERSGGGTAVARGDIGGGDDGYRSMVFNAVVETNPAVALWTSLGFTVLGTVPDAYEHARHGPVGLHIMYRAL